MGTNYGPQGPQEPPWQGKPPQMPPWMQQPQLPQNEQPPPWIQQHLAKGQLPQQPGQGFQPPMMSPPKSKKPWHRTGCGISVIVLVALLACGTCSGIVSSVTRASQQTATVSTPRVAPTLPAVTQTANPLLLTPTDSPIPTTVLATPTPARAVQPPTPTPIPRPTQPPAPTPVPQLGIQFTTVVNEDVAVQTAPGATLTIKVLYHCSGHYATSQSLQGTFTADSGGNMEWTWTNRSSCSGAVTAYVTASAGGKTVSNAADFSD